MKQPHFSRTRLLLPGAALLILLTPLHALEPRTWISLDGRTLDAELVKRDGDIVELRDKTGTILKVPWNSLSFGDHDYIDEYAPESTGSTLGTKPAAKAKVPVPAKEMKLSTKTFKKDAGEMKLGSAVFRICETPHFKILYSKGVDPMDMAELAERLWHDAAFFHASFAGKFKDRRRAIIMAESGDDFDQVAEWYREALVAAGNTEAAASVARTWSRAAATGLNLPEETAAQNGLLTSATLLRMATRNSGKSKGKDDAEKSQGDTSKGVWSSFRTHILAGDLLNLQAGGLASFAKEGQFAIFIGHSYFKEIDLTGASATSLIQQDTGKNLNSTGGYDTGRNWAAELKRRVRKGDIKPKLTVLWAGSREDATPDDLALAYSFSRFLQSTPERHTAYGKLMERISTSKQVPAIDDVAKIYGLEDGAALEKAWLDFVGSGDFR